MEKDLIYYPVNVTPMYETMKNNKTFQSDRNYQAAWEEVKYQNKFNAAVTQKYTDDLKIGKIQSDKHYRKEWNDKQRHHFKTPAVTMEERDTFEETYFGVYKREAQQLSMKYDLL